MSAPLISPSRAAGAYTLDLRVHLPRPAQTFSSRTLTYFQDSIVLHRRTPQEGNSMDQHSIDHNVPYQLVGFAATGLGKVALTLSTLSLLVGGLLVSVCSR